MTVSNQTSRTSVVGTNAIGQAIPFFFPIADSSDLLVMTRVIATGIEATLGETTNYTVAISSDLGGTVTMVTAVAVTSQIHVIRNTPATQSLDLEHGGSFSAENIEDALDKNTRLAAESADKLSNKAIVFPETDASTLITELPSAIDRASQVLSFDSDGNATSSVAVPEGSVSFTTIGTNIAEAANAAAVKTLLNLITVFNVMDYGAVADGDGAGGGTDNATAFQDAVTAAANATLVIPDGTYRIDTGLTSTSRIEIIGFGKPILDFSNLSGAEKAFLLKNGTTDMGPHIIMRNLRIDGPEAAAETGATSTTTRGIDVQYTSGLRLIDVQVRDFYIGVYITAVWPLYTETCEFRENYIGLQLDDNCTIGQHNSDEYITNYFNLYCHLTVTNQTFTSCHLSSSGNNSVVCDPAGDTQLGFQFINPYFEGVGGSCFTFGLTLNEVDSTGNLFNVLISGGVQSAITGEFIKCSPANVTCQGFTILNPTGSAGGAGFDGPSAITGVLKTSLVVPSGISGDADASMYWYDHNGVVSRVLHSGSQVANEVNFVDDDATPSVKASTGEQIRWFVCKNDNTGITNFDDGVEGQEIILRAGGTEDSYVMHDSTKINLAGGENWVGKESSRDTLHLIYDGGRWDEISRTNGTHEQIVCNGNMVLCNDNQVVKN